MTQTYNEQRFLNLSQKKNNEISPNFVRPGLDEKSLPSLQNPKTNPKDEEAISVTLESVSPTSGTMNEIVSSYIHLHDDVDEPFALLDLASVVEKYDQWTSLLPRVEPHYAVKCNSDLVILETLARLGCKFDCASKGEIEMVLSFNETLSVPVSPNDIIFANPCKPKGHLLYAKDKGVKQMTFDNLKELQKIRDVYSDAELFLRISVDDSGAICQLSSKFGAKLSLCPKLLKEAKEMGLNVVGLSFHVGSGQQTIEAYIDALDRAKSVFDMAEGLGLKLKVLDIGGGFPGFDDDEVFMEFSKIALSISEKIDELFPDTRIIAEPGRYFVAACCNLVTKCYAKRESEKGLDDEETSNVSEYYYYINDGVYGSFNNIIYDHASIGSPKFLRDTSYLPLYRSTVFGPSCDGLDTLLKNFPLPEINIDEWIYWPNMGAYTICAAASFNGFPLPKIHYIWRLK